jgi:hypothetical protein
VFRPPASAFQARDSSGTSFTLVVALRRRRIAVGRFEKMAIPAGVEPACRLIRNQVLIQLSYGTEGMRASGSGWGRAAVDEPPETPASRCCRMRQRSGGVATLNERRLELAIPAGVEPACLLIRNQVLLRLSYGILGARNRCSRTPDRGLRERHHRVDQELGSYCANTWAIPKIGSSDAAPKAICPFHRMAFSGAPPNADASPGAEPR